MDTNSNLIVKRYFDIPEDVRKRLTLDQRINGAIRMPWGKEKIAAYWAART